MNHFQLPLVMVQKPLENNYLDNYPQIREPVTVQKSIRKFPAHHKNNNRKSKTRPIEEDKKNDFIFSCYPSPDAVQSSPREPFSGIISPARESQICE